MLSSRIWQFYFFNVDFYEGYSFCIPLYSMYVAITYTSQWPHKIKLQYNPIPYLHLNLC